jgi:two-component system, chemotaxis family, response regulator Rcp1
MVKTREENHPFEILLVEDNMGDVYLLRMALETVRVPVHLTVVTDGEAAIRHVLQQKGEAIPQPDLILLDLSLPKKSGYEVLAAVRAHPDTSCVPVLILSSSDASHDIRRAYELHANGYIRKPSDIEDLKNIITGIENFWLSVAKLPSE